MDDDINMNKGNDQDVNRTYKNEKNKEEDKYGKK